MWNAVLWILVELFFLKLVLLACEIQLVEEQIELNYDIEMRRASNQILMRRAKTKSAENENATTRPPLARSRGPNSQLNFPKPRPAWPANGRAREPWGAGGEQGKKKAYCRGVGGGPLPARRPAGRAPPGAPRNSGKSAGKFGRRLAARAQPPVPQDFR